MLQVVLLLCSRNQIENAKKQAQFPRLYPWNSSSEASMLLKGCLALLLCAASSAFILPPSLYFAPAQSATQLKASQPQEEPVR
jgi:hypothetical protein